MDAKYNLFFTKLNKLSERNMIAMINGLPKIAISKMVIGNSRNMAAGFSFVLPPVLRELTVLLMANEVTIAAIIKGSLIENC